MDKLEKIKDIVIECEERQKTAPHQMSKDVFKVEAYAKIKKIVESNITTDAVSGEDYE